MQNEALLFTLQIETETIVGEGAYGKIMLCRAKATGCLVAIKSVSQD